ncbi:MAG: chromosome segregation protein SMC [Gammaproteobacteria bacterium]|nr:chromosome segregation protein SMC [Gammaproteobacteria bacterium]
MRLKQIKLAGFKSFVDPTTVTLPGNRCAVVGPNGCGKSNIIDAVRWVMGESSAKQLRGENITDVIFNGSNTRKPTSMASIELLFDNSDGRIGGEYASFGEISIRRQVTREAQSSYFLNGSKCRRRDVMDIFLGTGFGPRSYSIIEQGMITELVEAKPEDLRAYLEEAAGISKYKERRRETRNRIKHTFENLDRLTDIREELGRQLALLKRQSKAAERYRTLKVKEKRLTAELHTLRYLELESELARRQSEISQLEIELTRVVAAQQTVDTDIEKRRALHAEANDEFNGVQGRYYQLGADLARIEEAIQHNKERVKQLELDLGMVNQRSEETHRQLDMDKTQIAELAAQISHLDPQVKDARLEDRRCTQRMDDLETRYRAWQVAWDEFSVKAAENERDAEVQASRVEHLEQLLQRFRGRREQLEGDAEGASGEQSDRVNSLAAEIQSSEHTRRVLETEIDLSLSELAAAREDLLMRERVLEDARGEVQTLRHELASLQAVQQAALGRGEREAQDWIETQGLGESDRLGEVLSVVPGWEHAVETVLGDYLQAIRVDRLEDYRGGFENLAHGVTLLEARIEGEVFGELPSLASLVSSQGLKLGSVLHGVYAAESMDVALARRDSLGPGESVITRQGFWIGSDWVRMLSDVEGDAGIIQRAQEIETLNLRVEQAEQTLAELRGHVVSGRGRIELLEGQREIQQRSVNELNQSLGELKADHGARRVQMEEADARRGRLVRERREIDEQIEQDGELLNQARDALVNAETQRETQTGERQELLALRETTEHQLDAAREAARGSSDAYHALNTTWQNLQSRLAAGETALDRLVHQKGELEAQQASLLQGIEASSTPLPELTQQLGAKLAERLAVESQLTEVRTKLEQLEADVRELEAQRTQAQQKVSDVRTQLEEVRVNRQGLTVQETNLVELVVATGHDFEEVRAQLPEDADEADWVASLEKTDRSIQRLGPINLAAIEEFDAQSARKVYLDRQHEDLEQAMETLQDAIKKIDRETRMRFKKTFDAVNAELGELFPKIFGGGHAYLELTGEDLLDAGVSLMARPPGKRNANVHLLSGGEKALTAVALIFAIFHLNPSPVCLLDEVDAPLDDTNVLRFADLIKEMSTDVQFVLITHNKLTMEMADHLMGVTMSEPGVSRLVSVDVEEAAAMAVM